MLAIRPRADGPAAGADARRASLGLAPVIIKDVFRALVQLNREA